MALENFTLLVVPGHEAEVKRYQVRARLVVLAIASVVVVLAAVGVLARHLVTLQPTVHENAVLAAENQALRTELAAVQGRLGSLGESLARVELVDERLRARTQGAAQPSALAIGPTQPPRGASAELEADHVARRAPPALENLARTASSLETEAQRREHSLQQLLAYFSEQESLLASTPSIWPLHGPLSSDFGSRADPFTFEHDSHPALDISGKLGAPVIAPANGTVIFAGFEGGYGNVVVIDHGRGLRTRYGHLSAFKVKAGEQVHRGQTIAAVGTTGHSTGPHLHYEVRLDGRALNPRQFLLEE